MSSNKKIVPIEISEDENEIIFTDNEFENYYENANNYLNEISGEDLINIKFPSIREMEPTFKISDQFIFIINPQCEMRIKEIIKLDLLIVNVRLITEMRLRLITNMGDLIKVLNSNLPKTQDKVVDTKKNYIKLLDSFKSITQIIGDDPDKYEETKTLFEETYHKLKREKEEKEEREEKEIIDNDDNKIKNPIPTKTKGHPKKGSNSKKNITKTNNSKKN
ncbi:7539_t:CDS:2 [Entrophospora sp. SA101]|nr:7539_t:CDS:2 [Entrophospora sp. SA101]